MHRKETPSEIHQETTVTTDITLESEPTTSNLISGNNKNTDICSISDKEACTGSFSDSIDLRHRNVPAYKNIFPEFCHSTLENGWYCKICKSFSANVMANRTFVTKAGTFGDHPTW